MVKGPQLNAVLQAFDSTTTFCRESLEIRNKQGRNVVMEPQPAQVKLYSAIDLAELRQLPFRAMYLKARQVMVSSAFEAYIYKRVAFNYGQKARVVAHNGDSASLVYEYFQQFARNYKPFRGVVGAANVVLDADGHMLFDNDSEVTVSTAGNPEAGRGGAVRLIHFSEAAFYRNFMKLMAGMMNSMPDDPGTAMLIESTANGASGDFYDLWHEANEYVKLFFAWFEHPEYTRPIEGDIRRFQDSLTQEELGLMTNHRCTLQQLAWRRWKIRTTCKGSVAQFHQEYPSTPEEAFLNSGRPRFDLISIGMMPRREPNFRGELVKLDDQRIRREEAELGSVHIWKEPVAGCRYVAGVDIAEGIDAGAVGGKAQVGQEDPDYSVLQLHNADSGEQVAMIRGRIEPAEMAKLTVLLGRLYFFPFLVPEANGPGLAYLQALQTGNEYPMARVYHRTPGPDEILTSGNEQLLQKLGFKTTAITRPTLIANLAEAIRQLALPVHDPATIGELRAFVIKPNGRAEANDRHHDDCVIAEALMLEGLQSLPAEKPKMAPGAERRPDGPKKYGGSAKKKLGGLMSLAELRRRAG